MNGTKKDLVLYKHMRDVMDKHADIGIGNISYDKAKWVLSRFMIPKEIRMQIIDEMIEAGILKRVNQRGLEIKW